MIGMHKDSLVGGRMSIDISLTSSFLKICITIIALTTMYMDGFLSFSL